MNTKDLSEHEEWSTEENAVISSLAQRMYDICTENINDPELIFASIMVLLASFCRAYNTVQDTEWMLDDLAEMVEEAFRRTYEAQSVLPFSANN